MRTYTELIRRNSFLARFRYAKLEGSVGVATFGFDRPFNQSFYQSAEWKNIRDFVIVRDEGCDLGHPDFPIMKKVLVHHMNPIALTDIQEANQDILDPEYLICVSMDTHNAIHFADERRLPSLMVERRPGDTKLW